MAGTVIPFVKPHWLTDAGAIASGYLLFSYEAGTTTKLATYSDADLTVPNSNPIVLDSAGRADVFLSGTTYKFVLAPPTDTDPPTSPVWTVDDVIAVPGSDPGSGDVTAVAGENIDASDAIYLSDGSGGNTAGRWYKADADFDYASVNAAAIGFAPAAIVAAATGTARIVGRITGLSALTPGATYYISTTAGGITIAPPTNARAIGQADTTTSLVLGSALPPPVATATVSGIVSTSAQSFGGLKTFTGGLQSDSFLTYKAPGGSTYLGVPANLNSQYTVVGNVGSGEDDLMTYTLPAATLATNGHVIKVLGWGKTANNANAKTIKGYFGATQVFGGSGAACTVSELGNWIGGFTVIRRSATTQYAAANIICGPAGSSITLSIGATTSPGETLANAIVIKFTGEATSDNDVTMEGMQVQFLPF